MDKTSTITLVGVGSLGSALAARLVKENVPRLRLLDRDVVSKHNLAHQHLYSRNDIGRAKVDAANDALRKLQFSTAIEIFATELTGATAHLLQGVVIDCTDNIFSRHIINEALINKANWIHTAVLGDVGVSGIFANDSGCFSCYVKGKEATSTCLEAGISPATLSGTVTLALRLLRELSTTTQSFLLRTNWKTNQQSKVLIPKQTRCNVCAGKRNHLSAAPQQASRICSTGLYQLRVPPELVVHLPFRFPDIRRQGSMLLLGNIRFFKDGRVLLSATSARQARSILANFIPS